MDHPETLVAVTAGTAGTYGVVAVAGIAAIAGLTVKKPQPLAHTCQSTPALVVSLATAAARFTVAFVSICAGSAGMKLTERVVDGLIVMELELMLTLGSATEVATIVTEVPLDVTGGAVYVAVAPLAVWAGTTQPQPPGTVLLHCAVQVTPPGGTSFVTVALTGACAVAAIVPGGACLNTRDGGTATTVVKAIAGFDVVAGEDAVIVTRPPVGTVAGAV